MTQQKPIKQSDTSFEEINRLVWVYLVERGWHELSPRSLATSIAIEAGELLEHYQWSDTPAKDKKEIAHELADVLIYCFEFAQATDIDIASAIKEKLTLTSKKYPPMPQADQKTRDKAYQQAHDKHRQARKKTA